VKLIRRLTSRHILPPAIVLAVLAVAYMTPLPTQASKTENCGVKAGYGYAFHGQGKPCPNRPFPGKGKGIADFPAVSSGTSAPQGTSTTSSQGTSATSSDVAESQSVSAGNSSSSKSHGHGKSLAHGGGHRNQTARS